MRWPWHRERIDWDERAARLLDLCCPSLAEVERALAERDSVPLSPDGGDAA